MFDIETIHLKTEYAKIYGKVRNQSYFLPKSTLICANQLDQSLDNFNILLRPQVYVCKSTEHWDIKDLKQLPKAKILAIRHSPKVFRMRSCIALWVAALRAIGKSWSSPAQRSRDK